VVAESAGVAGEVGMMSETLGPNVKRLIAHKMALLAIPVGSGDKSFDVGVNAFLDRERFSSMAAEASNWVRQAITLIKTAPDNPYRDDEEIATAILKGIKEREQ